MLELPHLVTHHVPGTPSAPVYRFLSHSRAYVITYVLRDSSGHFMCERQLTNRVHAASSETALTQFFDKNHILMSGT
jgi:hypothetical protein